MRFDVLTLFPDMVRAHLREGMLGRAIAKGMLRAEVHNIRDFARGAHKTTDDRPFGGGEGMVMKPGPIYRALSAIRRAETGSQVILLSPQGEVFDRNVAWELARLEQLIFLCGRYEGIDERIRTACIDRELSIGDYVLSGGEVAAMAVMEAVSRLIPGVLGGERSHLEESFEEGLLEYPQYTRPRVFLGQTVPEVLLSGDHERIRRWRRKESLRRTLERRPDLLQAAGLTPEDERLLAELEDEM